MRLSESTNPVPVNVSYHVKALSFVAAVLLAFTLPAFGQADRIDIKVAANKLMLNGTVVNMPVKVVELQRLIGKEDRIVVGVRTVYVWDELGFVAYREDGKDVVTEIDPVFDIAHNRFEFTPRKPFSGTLSIDGVTVDRSSTLESVNRKLKGKRFSTLVPTMSDLSLGHLYIVMLQIEHRPPGAGRVWQIGISKAKK